MVAFLDADDAWKPEKLEMQLAFMAAERVSLSFTGFNLIRDGIVDARVPEGPDLAKLLLGCDLSPGSTMMVRREVFDRVGPLDEDMRRLEDWAWLLRCSAAGYRFAVLDQILTDVFASGWPGYAIVKKSVRTLRRHCKGVIGGLKNWLRLESTAHLELSAAALHEERLFVSGWHAALALLLWYPRRQELFRRILRNLGLLRWSSLSGRQVDEDGAAPLRVLHVITGLDVGGAETMLTRFVTQAPAEVFSQMVVSLRPGGKCAEAISAAGIPVCDLGLVRRFPDLRAVLTLRRHIRTFRPHVVQGWMYHGDLMAALALLLSGRRRKTRLVWGIRCSDMDTSRYSVSLRMVIRLCALLSPLTDTVIANSHAGRRVHGQLGYRPARFEVIPNGIDIAKFRPMPECRAEVRRSLGIGPDVPVIACVARVDPMKDHMGLLRALERLPGVEALLVGKGTEKLPAQPGVHRLGLRHDVHVLLQAADLIVSSSSFGEGFSNALAEGMACGLPPVATDVGDSALIVGDTGLVVPPGDPTALADAIATLLNEPAEQRRARAADACARIADNFNMNQVVDRFADAYENMLVPGG